MNTLLYTSWNGKYHVVYAPKYRRKAFYGSRRMEIGAILRKLCEWKGNYTRSRSIFRSCSYAVRNTSQIPGIKYNGIFKR